MIHHPTITKEPFQQSSPCRSARNSSDPEPKNPDFVSWSMMSIQFSDTDQKIIKNLFQPSTFFEKTPPKIHQNHGNSFMLHFVPEKNNLQKREIMNSKKIVDLQHLDEFGP